MLPCIDSNIKWKRCRECLWWRMILQTTTDRRIDSPSKHSNWWRRTEHLFKATWRRRFANKFWRHLEDVLKTCWRRLEDVCGRRTANTSWRTLGRQKIIMLTTSSRRLEDILENQRWLLGRGRLRQRVQCQLLVGLPKINLLLFCGSIEKCLSSTIICLELDGGAGKYTKKTEIKLSKINFPILWWLLSPPLYT